MKLIPSANFNEKNTVPINIINNDNRSEIVPNNAFNISRTIYSPRIINRTASLSKV